MRRPLRCKRILPSEYRHTPSGKIPSLGIKNQAVRKKALLFAPTASLQTNFTLGVLTYAVGKNSFARHQKSSSPKRCCFLHLLHCLSEKAVLALIRDFKTAKSCKKTITFGLPKANRNGFFTASLN